MTLFLDLDNTILPSREAYLYTMGLLPIVWKEWTSLEPDTFLPLYAAARNKVKSQLKGHSSNRLRILCFKEMLTCQFGALDVNLLQTALFLEERYFQYFTEYLRTDRKNNASWERVFVLLREITREHKLLFLTNENLRTQLIKIVSFFPEDLKFKLLTSEEVGKEKPEKAYFEEALRISNSSPKDCIMIGDNFDDDIEGALSTGIRAVFQKERFGKEYSPKLTTEGVYESENIISSLEWVQSIAFRAVK